MKYKAALYSTKYHPDEREDVYAKDAELLKVAGDVPALKGNKSFATAVKKGTYDRWAMEMTALFGRKGVKGTPTFFHGDKKLVMAEVPQQQMTQAQYNQLAQANFKKMIDKEFGPAKGARRRRARHGQGRDGRRRQRHPRGRKGPRTKRLRRAERRTGNGRANSRSYRESPSRSHLPASKVIGRDRS